MIMMKKNFKTFGILFLYLGFTFGLDRIYSMIRWANLDSFNIDFDYLILDIFWIIFAIGSFIFLNYSIKKNINDKLFHNFQVVLGVYGAFSAPFIKISYLLNYSYRIFSNVFLFGSKLGILRIAFIFIAGLGVIGLLRKEEKI